VHPSGFMRRLSYALVVLTIWAANSNTAAAYSVLTHEAAIDATWDRSIRPLLEREFPNPSQEALNRARSFAYGGSVIQDLGYYPFGNKLFSNLLHYVRSGDFIEALIRESRDIDEYAFALGALAHYVNDTAGHPEATNRAVPLAFPKLKREFGDTVTYVEAPAQHVIVEFSFDVVQTAGGEYLPQAYQRFIGFRVASGVLERAFRDTYGLGMDSLFAEPDRAIETYRYAVSQVIPELTRAAWRDKHDEIVRLLPDIQRAGFVFRYGRTEYERDYGSNYQKPVLFARFLGFVYRILPKFGPLRPLSFKAPTPEVELMFARSFQQAADRYRAAIADVAAGRLDLVNTDFDTGCPSRHGEYGLADDTYADLLLEHERRAFVGVSERLRQNILRFYGAAPAPLTKDDRKHWTRIREALALLGDRGV
jgi:Zinc dependent phospholipase C